MQHYCNSWRVKHILAMVLRLNKSLKLAESIMSLHTHQAALAQRNVCTFLQCILHSSQVVDNAREDLFPFPQVFMLKEVHLRQLATYTYQITTSWIPSSCAPERSDHSLRARMRWTSSASWIWRYQRISRRLGCILQPWTHCKHRLLGVSTTATFSAAEGNKAQHHSSAKRLYCWAMGTQLSGLPWDEPTKQSLLAVCDASRVHILPVWNYEEGHEDTLWQREEGRKYRSAFAKLYKRAWRPEAGG